MGSTQLRQGGAGSSTNLGVAMQELSDPAQQFWSIFETKIEGRFQTKFTFIMENKSRCQTICDTNFPIIAKYCLNL